MHGSDQSACNKTEKAATTENGVCRVFDRAPIAGKEIFFDQKQTYGRFCLKNLEGNYVAEGENTYEESFE